MRYELKEVDNRDGNETWITVNDGGKEVVVELSIDDVFNILKSFYVNQVQNDKGQIDEDKVNENGKDLETALTALQKFVSDLKKECKTFKWADKTIREMNEDDALDLIVEMRDTEQLSLTKWRRILTGEFLVHNYIEDKGLEMLNK
jgi:hypothetical protein